MPNGWFIEVYEIEPQTAEPNCLGAVWHGTLKFQQAGDHCDLVSILTRNAFLRTSLRVALLTNLGCNWVIR